MNTSTMMMIEAAVVGDRVQASGDFARYVTTRFPDCDGHTQRFVCVGCAQRLPNLYNVALHVLSAGQRHVLAELCGGCGQWHPIDVGAVQRYLAAVSFD